MDFSNLIKKIVAPEDKTFTVEAEIKEKGNVTLRSNQYPYLELVNQIEESKSFLEEIKKTIKSFDDQEEEILDFKAYVENSIFDTFISDVSIKRSVIVLEALNGKLGKVLGTKDFKDGYGSLIHKYIIRSTSFEPLTDTDVTLQLSEDGDDYTCLHLTAKEIYSTSMQYGLIINQLKTTDKIAQEDLLQLLIIYPKMVIEKYALFGVVKMFVTLMESFYRTLSSFNLYKVSQSSIDFIESQVVKLNEIMTLITESSKNYQLQCAQLADTIKVYISQCIMDKSVYQSLKEDHEI